ncbi:MAG: ribonuclease J, partial [Deltaproteobacteria bacterium]|nr:ribonuclease J [Deltaproteobacteria bacterium]
MSENSVELIPLGGLGEIGLNTMVLKCGPDMVVIDSGLMFPEAHMYGVDFVIPDFGYLLEHADQIRAVILTHGHEDHIGGLPFLLSQINVPVYGTKLTLALIQDRLKEHDLEHEIQCRTVSPREKLTLGPFTFEFIRVCHSIPSGLGLAIETPAGCIIHSGDFKIDHGLPPEQATDLNKFAEYGERGVLALLSDSTNVERVGNSSSENSILDTFRGIFRASKGRIIIAMFASNILRIQRVTKIALEFDRHLAFDGRSMVTNVRIAREIGLLDFDKNREVSLGRISNIPDDKLVLISTGSQGEPMSALTRMALGEHKQVKIKPGDTVILSSRFIPGNERSITNIINNLYRQGAEMFYESVANVHVSGHAYQEELKTMIDLTRPEFFIPIHGEYRHLIRHAELARQVGLPAENLILMENGEHIRFAGKGFEKLERVDTGRILVDGKGVGDIGQAVLRDRRNLAEHGMVIVLLVINEHSGEILSGPDLISRGLIFDE